MPALRRVSDEALERAKLVRSQYKVAQPLKKPTGPPQPAELTVRVRSPVFDRVSVGFTLDGVFVGEEPFIPRTPGRSLGALAVVTGPRTLGVQVNASGRFFHISAPAEIAANGSLEVDIWSRLYPPRILLDGECLNPPPGVRFIAAAGAPCPGPGPCPLSIIDRDQKPEAPPRADLKALAQTLEVWIDGQPVDDYDGRTRFFGEPALHRARLSAGLHQVRIGDPVRAKILLDTDVVLDGARELRIEIRGRRDIVMLEAGQTIFRQERPEQPFKEGSTPTNEELDHHREIHGIPLPPGIEGYLEEVALQVRFNRAMIENFQLFKDLKASAERKKAAGEPLTPEEQEVDAIKEYPELSAWVSKRKFDEYGWVLEPEGETDEFGNIRFVGPPPDDPLSELSMRETVGIHEPSHAIDTDLVALEIDFDLEMWRRYREMHDKPARELRKWLEEAKAAEAAGLPPPPMPPIEIPGMSPESRRLERWYQRNLDKIRRYLELLREAVRGADAEIREYTADAEFWEAVLEFLSRQHYGWMVSDLSANLKVGNERTIRVQQIPDAPPRVRVIEGDALVEVSPTERTHNNTTLGWGQFDIKVKGKSPGRVQIELTCGMLRKVIVINVH
jgi:hypothetical protein